MFMTLMIDINDLFEIHTCTPRESALAADILV